MSLESGSMSRHARNVLIGLALLLSTALLIGIVYAWLLADASM